MPASRTPAGVALILAAGAIFAVGTAPPSPAQAPAQPPQSQLPPAVTPEQEAKSVTVLTEALGLVAGLQLYQTYLNIGLLADARAEDLYEASELAQLLGSVVTPLDQVDKQLEKVAGLKGLTKDDAAAVARMRKIAGLLRQEGKALQAFWDTGVDDHAKKYEAARQAAWKELDDLLELDPKKGAAPEPKSAEKK